jgi:hypothetical protein
MRNVFSALGRGVSVAAVVVVLSVPADAAVSRDGDRQSGGWWQPTRIVQIVKRFVGRVFGDEMVVPHP